MSIPNTSGGQSLSDAIQLYDDKQQQYYSCMLVTDTIEADGRFILCHLAAQHSGPVLWLAGGSAGEESTVRSAIRRLGGRTVENDVSVQSVAAFFEQQILKGDVDNEAADKNLNVVERLPTWEQLLAIVQDWRETVTDENHPLVIIDDISTLAALIGEREAYLLAYWARDLSFELGFHLVIRCLGTDETSFQATIAYFGAGGKKCNVNDDDEVYWEAGLAELAGQIIDVRPLASGYSRDAQGRFLISDKQQKKHSRLYNYMLLDNDIRVFRKV